MTAREAGTARDGRTAPPIDSLRTPGGRFSVRLRRRPLAVTAALTALALAAGLTGLCWGSAVGLGETIATLAGAGSDGAGFVVFELRAPRVAAALLVGACLGVGGAQFQTLTRNPLGSPDLVGFTWGAATGAVLVILVIGDEVLAVSTGAILFGLVTAAIMYGLAWRGGVQGVRLVLIGVAVSAMLEAVTTYLLIRADLYAAQAAHVWLIGSLRATTWGQVQLVLAAAAVLVPAAAALARPLNLLEMGDQVAGALGVRVERTRLGVLATAVGLTGVSVAAVGPIAFVALAAPQLARRLTRAGGVGVFAAAAMGALLLAVADLVARVLPLPGELPVGVVTGGLGGAYLAWLLARQPRMAR